MSTITTTMPDGQSIADPRKKVFLAYLMLISGLGGLLTGVDFGIIAGALLYLDKTVNVTEGELSFVVAMYSIGGFAASLVAGMCADWIGRKKMMIAGGLMFVVSIALIYTSQGFLSLVLARLLMGLAGGVLCVVVPLYMAESLPAAIRGRGTSVFQFLMTVGLLAALLIGFVFAAWHDAAVKAAAGDTAKIFAADSAAWRNMFLTAAVPGLLYTIGALFLKESPRWLFRRNRAAEAESILRRSAARRRRSGKWRKWARSPPNRRKPRASATSSPPFSSISTLCPSSSPASCWPATRPPASTPSSRSPP